jgi:hypothetical protein
LKDELSQKNNSDVGDEVSAIDNTSINKLLEEYNKETDKTKKA